MAANAVATVRTEEDEREQLMLSPAQRQQILGKLAEFEVMLLGLPDRERAFALAYIADPSVARNAALRAGIPEKTAHIQASKLLKKPRVAAVIAMGMNLREDRTMVTSDRTIHEAAIVAFSNLNDYIVHPATGEISVREGVPEYHVRAIQSAEFTMREERYEDDAGKEIITRTYKTKVRLWNKNDALRMLMMYQKLLSAGDVNINLNQQNNFHAHTWTWGDGRKLDF